MKIYANEFGDIFKMAAMPIYGKNLKKSSPELMDWSPWNLLCSSLYPSTTMIVQMMTLS